MFMVWNEDEFSDCLCCYNCAFRCIDDNDELYCGKDGYDTTEDDCCGWYVNENDIVITKEMEKKMIDVRSW